MDFFASQDAARRSSKLLLLLFVAAVLSIMALANLTVYVILKFQSLGTFHYSQTLALQICCAVLILVGLGSWWRIHSLKAGGEAIALALGGKIVTDGGATEQEQRLINVVEEMAIASGLPVPSVYLLDEEGINAFAAGYGNGDAVIGITRGALHELNREQLQGVVAHEFSHILNGDMRLNIRLVGVLHGILMLSIVGRVMLEARPGVGRKTSGAFPVLFLGLSLFLIGYIGKFFGDLIKAAVGRQREYLADASAVQFTRSADGIGGALKRIGGYVAGSNVHHAGAEEFSHLYFSSGRRLSSWLATHPPLDERIQRVDPDWDGEYFRHLSVSVPTSSDQVSGFAAQTTAREKVIAAVEHPEVVALQGAREILADIPTALKQAVKESYSVRAVVYLLLLDNDDDKRQAQLDVINEGADVFVRSRLKEIFAENGLVESHHKLPLMELSLPTLRQLSEAEFKRMSGNLKRLQLVSQPLSLSHWALVYYLQHHLAEAFGNARRRDGNVHIRNLKKEIGYLLSVVAYGDRSAAVSPQVAFEAGQAVLDLPLELAPKQTISVKRMEHAIQNVARLKPLQKPKLLKSLVAVICADNVVSPTETELIRIVADAIDCPLPPIELAQVSPVAL